MKQIEQVAKACAELVHYALSWEESMSKEHIELFVETLANELKELNGEA